MEIKKNPKSNLENYSKLFMQLGLVLALFITYAAMENKTYDKQIAELGSSDMGEEIEEETLTLMAPPPPPPPPPSAPAPPPPAPEKIEKIEDDAKEEETIMKTTETDESEKTELQDIPDPEPEPDEEIPEDVPFTRIEKVPVFPGCSGSNQQKKACFNKKMKKHIAKHFDGELANELGLDPGKKRIFVMFKIDKNGGISDIIAKAPHPRLKKEAERIIKKLPKIEPGKQRGRAVGVKYTLPITFNVE